MAGYRVLVGLAAAAALLAGCERPSAVASKPSGEAAPAAETAASSERAAPARTEAPVRLVDGKPMWAASRRGTAEENAQRSFERNGQDFAARDLDDFVRKAHAFVRNPPAGTQTLVRNNGDTLFYDPKGNTFAVATKDGAPRTLFKPEEGAAYWDQQKAREASRQTARAGRRENGADSGG
ncbi:MAG: hypothetical protein ACK41C_06190 [Phenylobacterium sp.]|uniref:hypothetical protein n=1 Tax=Phenylobacterium sp. TaxID=1871053 RepID=UPI00391AD1B2